MTAAYVTIVGKLKVGDGEEQDATISGMANVIMFVPGSPPPRPHPEPPPGTWGGAGQPFPTPPIPIYPGGTPNPPGIWGPPGPWPSPPIAFPPGWIGGVPPGGGEGEPQGPLFDWKVAWTPDTGWIVVAIPQFPHVAPSKA